MPDTAVCPVLPAAAGDTSAPAQTEFLSFRLGAVAYGLQTRDVREIRGYETPTPVPGAPAHLQGVLNLRGQMVPVLDLRVRFGLSQVRFDPLTVTVFLQLAGRTVGLVVDSVSDVLTLTPAQIRPLPPGTAGADACGILGIGVPDPARYGDMLVLLDMHTLLGADDLGPGAQAIH
jgi:purine-binding chemotaxis protein CheW